MHDALFELTHGVQFPYDSESEEGGDALGLPPAGYEVVDWAHAAALGVIHDLRDRRGIKWEFNKVDLDVRKQIVASLAEIIREAHRIDQQTR